MEKEKGKLCRGQENRTLEREYKTIVEDRS